MENQISEKTVTAPSQTKNIDKLVEEVIDFVSGIMVVDSYPISLALTEALSNAIIHGNGCDAGKRVSVHAQKCDHKVIFKVIDQGQGFKHNEVPDPTRAENLLKLNGRGIFLIQYFMDCVKFNRSGNEITMVKHVP